MRQVTVTLLSMKYWGRLSIDQGHTANNKVRLGRNQDTPFPKTVLHFPQCFRLRNLGGRKLRPKGMWEKK